jgi:hypothetical protein
VIIEQLLLYHEFPQLIFEFLGELGDLQCQVIKILAHIVQTRFGEGGRVVAGEQVHGLEMWRARECF